MPPQYTKDVYVYILVQFSRCHASQSSAMNRTAIILHSLGAETKHWNLWRLDHAPLLFAYQIGSNEMYQQCTLIFFFKYNSVINGWFVLMFFTLLRVWPLLPFIYILYRKTVKGTGCLRICFVLMHDRIMAKNCVKVLF